MDGACAAGGWTALARADQRDFGVSRHIFARRAPRAPAEFRHPAATSGTPRVTPIMDTADTLAARLPSAKSARRTCLPVPIAPPAPYALAPPRPSARPRARETHLNGRPPSWAAAILAAAILAASRRWM